MRPKLVLATSNRHKAHEIREILGEIPFDILTLADFPNLPPIAETGTTFFENALIKAQAVADFTGFASISDDSGLEIEILEGRPGLFSARYAGPQATDLQNLQKVIRELKGLKDLGPFPARFVCVASLVVTQNQKIQRCFEGVLKGHVICEPRGLQGFGYDPIFWLESHQKTLAEISLQEKNQLSHRRQAFNGLKDFLSMQSI